MLKSENVVPFVKNRPTTGKDQIRISKVYARGIIKATGLSTWAFDVEKNGERVGYEFETREDAIKGRVLTRNHHKELGFKILS